MTGTSSNARFIDSNVFVYAFVKPKVVNEKVKEIKEKAKEVILRVSKGEERVITTVVHVSEVANVIESLANLTTSLEVVESVLNSVEVRDVSVQDYIEALVVAKKEMISVNDALAYVIMKREGIKEIYTFDKHFKKLDVTVLPT